ncbi:MAG: bifunctional 4-hydroxy-2-oxoglutarate aldolase/2-dehydro-3-deoxy-phosphogluconate aldolase [Bacteroidota bacterium]|nr:bifunctional 4-hydroxy-2-oxoglutarate aldolase/2-dehydro-3-deoxy-phosphogluconate aldolase [Bacteroidota bacterium]
MDKILEEIGSFGIVPVIVISDASDALPLVQALKNGGLPVAEVTFRTNAAREAIENISKNFPDMLLGAGTVLSIEQVKTAIDAGAKFIVSPGFNRKVVEFCLSNNIPITPGIVTPTEIECALQYELEVVKFFPAELMGGINYLKAIAAPFNTLKFIPTGGINEHNLLDYLRFPKVLACGGSWMINSELITAKKFDEITKLTLKAVGQMLGFSIRHFGINCNSTNESLLLAREIASIFNLPLKEGLGSNFIGNEIELLKKNYLGQHGHIAVGTNFIERAVLHFERKGYHFNSQSANYKEGKLQSIFFESEFAGLTWHLIQN